MQNACNYTLSVAVSAHQFTNVKNDFVKIHILPFGLRFEHIHAFKLNECINEQTNEQPSLRWIDKINFFLN